MELQTVVTGVRRWTRNHDAHVRIAAELLLILHETWLRRADLAQAAIECGGAGAVTIDWRKARAFHDAGPIPSASEMAILDLAIALAENSYRLAIMGAASSCAIVVALAEAVGLSVPPTEVRRGG